MPKQAMKSRGESINHFNGVRIRVVGDGDLKVATYVPGGEIDILDETLIPYPMSWPTDKQPTLGMNARRQRISVEIKVEEIDEWFTIKRIIVFHKQLFTSFVGRG